MSCAISSPKALDSNVNSTECPSMSQRRKDMFGDCALIEIIHLHDCLRGALGSLEKEVQELHAALLQENSTKQQLNTLECRVNGRFKVIWSVFRAHSSAEDEFIWPALQLKTQGKVKGSPSYRPNHSSPSDTQVSNDDTEKMSTQPLQASQDAPSAVDDESVVDQESYEEDHADEERMFEIMDSLLTQLRDARNQQPQAYSTLPSPRETSIQVPTDAPSNAPSSSKSSIVKKSVNEIMISLVDVTSTLTRHLKAHLEKEETQCLPFVVKYLSKSEIHDLVGQIMGKRSSDVISEIMTMAVQSLNEDYRLEMLHYMKQAMAGTFFDKWLSMSGWIDNVKGTTPQSEDDSKRDPATSTGTEQPTSKRAKLAEPMIVPNLSEVSPSSPTVIPNVTAVQTNVARPIFHYSAGEITSQAELERLIRAIITNPTLTPLQKNTTIQSLRDSVYKSNQRVKGESSNTSSELTTCTPNDSAHITSDAESAAVSRTGVQARRVTPPSIYYKKAADGTVDVLWDMNNPRRGADVPLFSASELAPTYHDGVGGAVLGCPHYARACKLRHPVSGRLYTCRLCCEQERDMPSKNKDEPLDRYAVTEVMCMKCHALQPAGDRCINPNCESGGKPFATYNCNICHLYDDRPRPIFHCPYCNTCRMGQGLGIDFRHCMRCNACVALNDTDHRCIPQKLQGSCPICHESLFQSTEPLRGLKCGHVMHLSCFTEYCRGQRYTCPLCMKSVEDMSEYFGLLDAAVRMQPMPYAFLSTKCNIYCQDCERNGQCQYHFVGLKCQHCGSYNTRELGRVQSSSPNTFS